MKKIILMLFIILVVVNSFSQGFLGEIDVFKQAQQNTESVYFKEIWLKSADINDDNAVEFANRASEKIDMGYMKEALKDIDKAISIYPDFDLPYILKGFCKLKCDSLDVAMSHFDKAISINDKNPVSLYYKGLVNLSKSNYRKAKSYFGKSLKVDPKFYLAFYGLGNLYLEMGYWFKAKNRYKRVIKIYPNFIEAHYNLAILYFFTGRTSDGLKHLDDIIRINPNFSPPYYLKAIVYDSKEDSKEAVKLLDKAIEIDSTAVHYHLLKADIHIRIDEYQKAIKSLKSGFSLNPVKKDVFNKSFRTNGIRKAVDFQRILEVYENLNDNILKDIDEDVCKLLCYVARYKYILANNLINDLMLKYADVNFLNYIKGFLCEYMNDKDEALKYHSIALNGENTILSAYLNLSGIYLDKKEYKNAIKYSNNYLEYFQNDPMVYRYRGISYTKIGNYDKAINDFNSYLKIDSTNFDIMYNIASCYFLQKDYVNAENYYSLVIDINSLDRESYYKRAQCRYLRKNISGAIQDLDTIKSKFGYNKKSLLFGIELHYSERNFGRVIEYYTELIKHDDTFQYRYQRALCYIKNKEFDLAIKDYSKLIKQNKTNGEIYFRRGVVYNILKNKKKARRDLKKAVEYGENRAKAYLLIIEKNNK